MDENQEIILSKEIEKHFKFLFDRGFRIRSIQYIKEYMGYWEFVLESTSCLIQLSNDRGEVFLSLGTNNPEKEPMWFGLRTVVFYLSKGKNFISIFVGDLGDREKQFQRLANILAEYIDDIILVIGKDFEKHKLNLQRAKKQVLELDMHNT